MLVPAKFSFRKICIDIAAILSEAAFLCSVNCIIYNKDGIYANIYADLTQVPNDIPEDVEYVELRENNITALRKNAFSYLNKCEKLKMMYNSISEIENGSFLGLNKLKLCS